MTTYPDDQIAVLLAELEPQIDHEDDPAKTLLAIIRQQQARIAELEADRNGCLDEIDVLKHERGALEAQLAEARMQGERAMLWKVAGLIHWQTIIYKDGRFCMPPTKETLNLEEEAACSRAVQSAILASRSKT